MNQKKLIEIIAKSNSMVELNKTPIKTRLNLLDICDICESLNISRSTLLKLRNDNKFPPSEKYGNKIYWKRECVDLWLSENDTSKNT